MYVCLSDAGQTLWKHLNGQAGSSPDFESQSSMFIAHNFHLHNFTVSAGLNIVVRDVKQIIITDIMPWVSCMFFQ